MIFTKPSTVHPRGTRIRRSIVHGTLLTIALCALITALPEVAKGDDWNGYEKTDFSVGGRGALLVVPKQPAPGKHWIWRTEFFGIAPQADIALLGEGVYVAYIGVGGLFGAPVALDAMDKFYEHVTKTYGLNSKVVLEGFSRGGLYALNWAIRHPDRVACMYLDAPVCDFKSWPGGGGRVRMSGRDWRDCLAAYKMTDAQARAYKGNPIDNLAPLAKAKIPIFCVCGDMHDWVVPIEANTLLLESRYKELGGEVYVIRKPKAGHRPHSLPDPTPIVNFVLKNTTGGKMAEGKWKAEKAEKAKKALAAQKEAAAPAKAAPVANAAPQPYRQHIFFFGDSITKAGGYVRHIQGALNKQTPKFPPVVINFGHYSETISNLSEAYHPGRRPCMLNWLGAMVAEKPDFAVACYGINDAIYHPYDEKRFAAYKSGIETLIEKFNAVDTYVVLFTPPPFAAAGPPFPPGTTPAQREVLLAEANAKAEIEAQKDPKKYGYRTAYPYYDHVMARYTKWVLTLATRDGVSVVDIRTPMVAKIKEAYGGDAIHPNGRGHAIMAETFLKAWPAIQAKRLKFKAKAKPAAKGK